MVPPTSTVNVEDVVALAFVTVPVPYSPVTSGVTVEVQRRVRTDRDLAGVRAAGQRAEGRRRRTKLNCFAGRNVRSGGIVIGAAEDERAAARIEFHVAVAGDCAVELAGGAAVVDQRAPLTRLIVPVPSRTPLLAISSPSPPLTFSVPSTSIVPAPVGLVRESMLPTLMLSKFAVGAGDDDDRAGTGRLERARGCVADDRHGKVRRGRAGHVNQGPGGSACGCNLQFVDARHRRREV